MNIHSLSGHDWSLVPDPDGEGTGPSPWYSPSWLEEHVKDARKILVPHCWQTMDGLERYEGACWYFTRIRRGILSDATLNGKQVRLHFKGANYVTHAWLNGVHLGKNEGGFLPFWFAVGTKTIQDVLDASDGDPLLAVQVDNTRLPDGVPEFSTDWFQWGGIYRDVYVEITGSARVERCLVTPVIGFGADGSIEHARISIDLLVTPTFSPHWIVLDPSGVEACKGTLDPANAQLHPHLEGYSTIRATLSIPNPMLWDVDRPALYTLLLNDDAGELVHRTRFGLREIKKRGTTILLNRKPVLFKGCSLHEEKYPAGREYPAEERKRDLLAMKALGFNFLRTAHYSHDESLIDAADEVGMLIGEEIPVYWNIDYSNPRTLKLAVSMMRTLIRRDFNHPSVIWWSTGNEVPTARRDCQLFIRMLLKLAKKMDPTRFAVYVTKNWVYDPIRPHTDLILLNGYLGWYYGGTRHWVLALELVHATAPRTPLLVSEFGAGAKLGFGRREAIDEQFSEWKQASVVGHAIKTFNSKSFMSGWLVWIYRDFKSHMRRNKYQMGYNRKGIVDEKGRKKLLGLWMPKLVNDSIRYRPAMSVLGFILSKVFWLPMATIGIVVDIVAAKFMHGRNEGYYTRRPE